MKKLIFTFGLFTFTLQSSAFVVFDLAAEAMGLMTEQQLSALNSTEWSQFLKLEDQLEQLEQQYGKLTDINDELNSVMGNWDEIAQSAFRELRRIEGLNWIDESGLYDIFGGMTRNDIERIFRDPAAALRRKVFTNVPFNFDEDNMTQSWINALEWAGDVIEDQESTEYEKSGAVVIMSDILAAKYQTNSEESLKTVEALANASSNLSNEINSETNMGDNMVGINKQAAVTNNLIAEQIRQEREANEVLISKSQAETEILKIQERRARERAQVEALR